LCPARLPVRATQLRRNRDAGSAWRALYGRKVLPSQRSRPINWIGIAPTVFKV
jgi:hypothetical protein